MATVTFSDWWLISFTCRGRTLIVVQNLKHRRLSPLPNAHWYAFMAATPELLLMTAEPPDAVATGRDALPRDPAPLVQRRYKCNNRRSYWERASAPIAQERVGRSSKKQRRDMQRRTRGSASLPASVKRLGPII